MKKIIFIFLTILLTLGCSKKEVDERVVWLNTATAILTTLNEKDITLFGGVKKTDENTSIYAQQLKSNYHIQTANDVQAVIDTLINGKENSLFLEEIQYYELDHKSEEEIQTLLENMKKRNSPDEAYITFLYTIYQTYGERGIYGFDLIRALDVCSNSYIAGYLSYEEAVEKSASIAKLIQKNMNSWDELSQNYLYGYQFFSGEPAPIEGNGTFLRQQAYEQLRLQGIYELPYFSNF